MRLIDVAPKPSEKQMLHFGREKFAGNGRKQLRQFRQLRSDNTGQDSGTSSQLLIFLEDSSSNKERNEASEKKIMGDE